jgi:FtsP/CotA-like multicopper oxidase with cupredoxin domain
MSAFTRRSFLATATATACAGTAPALLLPAAAAPTPIRLRADTRVIDVRGRAATVFGITQPNGSHGLVTQAGQGFRVSLENRLGESTLIHWHGLTPPWAQDGVPGLTQAPLVPGATHEYDFPLDRPGTNWMHSHHGLQEQRLLAAPLIVRDPAQAGEDVREVVVLFHDFSFRAPDEILAQLRGDNHAGHGPRWMGPGGRHALRHGAVHLHDVDYDAFLANDRTLDDPEVFRVERGGRVRLRLINGATATQFWLDLGALTGTLVAVDGMPVQPLQGQRFEFSMGQRLDVMLDLPASEGAWPVTVVREGERERTGFVLATRAGEVRKTSSLARAAAAPVGLGLERRLRASRPLPERAPDRRHELVITEVPGYVWQLNGQVHGAHTPLHARRGERVEIRFVDRTSMAHPMHLHGHHFQVVEIDGRRLAGAMRDTVLVPAGGSVTIAFDAVSPGEWPLHCHHLYHMATGMMTTIHVQA